MDNASRELEITTAKQHHMALLRKKKEDKKRDADAVFNDWTETVTLDSIMLSSDFKSIKSISSRPVGDWNMKHMRFCAPNSRSRDTTSKGGNTSFAEKPELILPKITSFFLRFTREKTQYYKKSYCNYSDIKTSFEVNMRSTLINLRSSKKILRILTFILQGHHLKI
jgi:hypothetical protein